MRKEEGVHFAVCNYLRLAYPKIIFLSESSGVRTSIGLATKLKKTRSSDVHLDLYILEAVKNYHGLILELKADSVYKKDGTLFKSEHLEDQQKTINKLMNKGYYASFACGFDEAKILIDNYLHGRL